MSVPKHVLPPMHMFPTNTTVRQTLTSSVKASPTPDPRVLRVAQQTFTSTQTQHKESNTTTTNTSPSRFSSLCRYVANSRLVLKLASKVLIQFNASTIKAHRESLGKELADSKPVIDAMTALSPLIANLLASKDEIIKSFHSAAKGDFEENIETILLTAVSNIVKATKVAKGDNNPVTMTDLIGHMIQIVQKHSEQIEKDLSEAERLRDPAAKAKKLKLAFTPLTNEILAIAFPKGKSDLGLRSAISGLVWDSIADPMNFAQIYGLLMGAPGEAKEKALGRTPSGGALLMGSNFVTQQVVKKIPQLGIENAQMIGGMAANIIGVDISAWVSSTITDIARSRNRNIVAVWEFVENRINESISRAFYNVGTGNGTEELGPDPFTKVLNKFRPIITDFYLRNGTKLKEQYQAVARGSEAEKAKWAAEVFGPLAHSILSLTHIDEELPSLVKAFGIDKTIHNQLPNWLFKIYGSVADSIPGLTEWIDPKVANDTANAKIAALPGGQVAVALSKGIANVAANALPQQCTNEMAASVADMIVDKIAATLPIFQVEDKALREWTGSIKAWMRTWTINAIQTAGSNHSSNVARETMTELKRIWAALDEVPDSQRNQLEIAIASKTEAWLLKKNQGDQTPIEILADEIQAEVIKHCPAFATEPPAIQNGFKAWFSNKVGTIATQHPEVAPLWKFIGEHIEGILGALSSHIILENQALEAIFLMNQMPYGGENADAETPRTVIQKFSVLAREFATQHGDQVNAAITAIAQLPPDQVVAKKQQTAALIALFRPLSEELCNLVGLDKVKKLSLFGLNAQLKNEIVPQLLLNLYQQMLQPKKGYSATYDRLCNMLFNKERYMRAKNLDPNNPLDVQRATPQGMSEDNRQLFWREAGVESIAQEVTRFTTVTAGIIKKSTQNFLRTYDAAKMVSDVLGVNLNQAGMQLLNDEVHRLVEGDESGSKEILDYTQHMLEVTMPKVLINIVESTEAAKRQAQAQAAAAAAAQPQGAVLPVQPAPGANGPAAPPVPLPAAPPAAEKHHLASVPSDFMARVTTLLGNRLQGIDQRVKDIKAQEPNLEKRQKKLRELFLPLTKDLLSMAGADVALSTHPLHDIPGPISLKKNIWDKMIPGIIADMLVSYHGDMYQEIEPLQKEQQEIYKSKHVQVMSHVLAEFTKAFVPHLLANKNDKMAEAFKEITDYLRANHVDISDMLLSNIKGVGENKEFAALWAFLSSYMEPIMLRLVGGISKTFNKIERNADGSHNPEFMLDCTKLALEALERHVLTVNEITRQHKKSHPHQISKDDMRAGFLGKTRLHQALMSAKHRQEWFALLTERVLKLASMNSQNMPFPAPIREMMFSMVKEKLGPQIIQNLYESMGDRHTQNGMKLTIIDNMQKMFEALMLPAVPQAAPQNRPPLSAAEQRTEKEWRETCGRVGQEFVKWLPNTLLNAVVNNVDAVRSLSGEMIANSTEAQIKQWSFIRIMKQTLESSIPSIHPGMWEYDHQFQINDKFKAAKLERENGRDKLTPIDQLKFNFSPTPADEAAQKERIEQRAKEFTVNSEKLGNTGFDVTVDKTLSALWSKIESAINSVLEFFFRGYAGPVQWFVKEVLTFIGKVLGVAFYPIYRILHLIQEWHISKQVDHLDKNISHSINENFVLQIIDLFIDNALARKQQMEVQEAAARAAAAPQVAAAQPHHGAHAPIPPEVEGAVHPIIVGALPVPGVAL